jgi:hypothetical protein
MNAKRDGVMSGVRQCVLIASVTLWVVCPSLYAANASEETKATINEVIKACASMECPASGKGLAVVKVTDGDISKTCFAEFVFKVGSTCSKLYGEKEGKQDKLESVWAMGPQGSLVYNGRDVTLQKTPPSRYLNALGYDFHPWTFNRCSGIALPTFLDRSLKGPSTLSTQTDPNGLLRLITQYKDNDSRQDMTLTFDKTKGCRLVGTIWTGKWPSQPDQDQTQITELNWKKAGSSWYIGSARDVAYAGAFAGEKQALAAKANTVRSMQVTIKEFSPDVEVADSAFTLQGLNLPATVKVVDRTK